MKKRFVVLLDSSSKEQNSEFLNWIKEQGLGSWHWLSHSWLIVDSAGISKASEIGNVVRNIYGATNHFVIEISEDGDTWSGFGPKGEDRNMFTWIHKNWNNKT